jgi:hypothetical protein
LARLSTKKDIAMTFGRFGDELMLEFKRTEARV